MFASQEITPVQRTVTGSGGSPYGEQMRPFDRVVLIFNPASTGDASTLAAELRDELQRRQPDLPVTLQPTEHAGHARDLARDAARTRRPLLVSVSSDGGYNEVVDGTMQAGNDAVVCAVLPAGNANDHRRASKCALVTRHGSTVRKPMAIASPQGDSGPPLGRASQNPNNALLPEGRRSLRQAVCSRQHG